MTAIRHNSDKYAVYVERHRWPQDSHCARVTIYEILPREQGTGMVPRLGRKIADYETDSRGATASARREIARLENGR